MIAIRGFIDDLRENSFNMLLQQQEIGQNKGRNSLQHHRYAKCYAEIMPALYGKRFQFIRLPVKGVLFLWRRGCGFDRNTEDKLVTIRNAAHHTPRMVGAGPAIGILYRIIVIAAEHPGGRKAGAELNTPDRRDREYR